MRQLPAILRAESEPDAPRLLTFETSPSVKIEAAAGEPNASPRIELTAYTGGAMIPTGFYEPVVVDLTGVKARSPNLPLLRDHDRSKVVGHTESIEISAQRIYATGVLSVPNEHQQEIVAGARNQFPWGVSVSGPIRKLEFVAPGAKVKVNGRIFDGPIYVAREVELAEITIAAIAADPNTRIKVAATAAASEEHQMNFSAWLKSKGHVEANLSADQLQTLRAEYDAGVAAGTIKAEAAPGPNPTLATPPGAPAAQPANPAPSAEPASIQATLEANRRTLAEEARRVAKIQELAKGHPTIQATAIEQGWTSERTELEVLKASRPTAAPGGIVRAGGVVTSLVLEAALCQSLRLPGIEKQFDAKTLEAAHSQFRGVIGLKEALVLAAEANGYQGQQGPWAIDRDLGGVLKAAMPGPSLQASFSSLSLPGIFANTANKFLLAAFMAVERTWRGITAVRPVRDFKTVTSYRLTGDMVYAEVGPDGELKHATVGEQSFTNRAKTYGRMFGLTRTDIINDDLGALASAPQMIGRGGALKLNSVFWTEFMANTASFFTSGNANFASGAGTALGVDSLTQAETLFFNQTDPNGHPLGISPAILLVPNALFVTGTNLMASVEVRDTTASTKGLTKNPHAGKFRVERSSYLSNSSITGYSALKWYLLADPADLPVIEVAFLNGNETPTVETAEADFNVLGIQMRGYHDFGVSKQEHRAGVAMKGEA